jgi:adenosylhomocysteine nucleosidase
MFGADESTDAGAGAGGGILILTAIAEEHVAVARAVSDAGLDSRARVVRTGDGGVRAERAGREAIAAFRPAAVIGAGVAGGLSEELAPGEIVVSVRVLDAAEEAPPPDPALVARALELPGLRAGTLLTVVRPALSVSQKAALLARAEAASPAGTAEAATHGAAGTASVDMESAAWARACAAAGVPYVILRAISDTADEDLPRYLALCMDKEGGIRRAAVARGAVLHPSAVPALLRMRRRVGDCCRSLGAAVAALAASLPRA